ncbi:MaoC/PaaZ C-terminal domain-containing protein [Stackebrandtia nassauensis]|uniref:MaoC domain protein dehydratase n=1 Tax=Stackebrandtia nassauensis (strain DSM 44728 / CIP 108903 / NRRL B-16338 / NBRC 102104 / LLR-40K-21) TaxID=446470 RepID=D3Q495_STANL|nr:MaoC/PaaZ C-terminal domain-containing protein [Stackebrandtia nassauensis]ADD45980.1 MaoC domain protein dehydratase [Stackebrandtia nassauensis DSM 44728]
MNPGDELFSVEYAIHRADLAAYAAASGDNNPIHLDDTAAKAAGLPGVIAHGMYTMGLAARAVADWAGGPAKVAALTARFAKPVPVPADSPATVTVSGAVRKVLDDGAIEVNLTVQCDGTKVLAPARATVRI